MILLPVTLVQVFVLPDHKLFNIKTDDVPDDILVPALRIEDEIFVIFALELTPLLL